jgi:CheY-like chemotaxis protein
MQHVTILVVDDDDGHMELVRRNLRRSGINNPIVTMTTGTEALDYVLRRDAYASRGTSDDLLVLLDINMPGLDGVEVLRQIKADPEARKIPVLMLTTTDDPREVNRCYELGCNIYITKPVDPAAFMEAIQRLGLFLSVVSIPADQPGLSR